MTEHEHTFYPVYLKGPYWKGYQTEASPVTSYDTNAYDLVIACTCGAYKVIDAHHIGY
jgi:hypothetical protein